MKRTARKQQADAGKQPVTVDRARLHAAHGGLDTAGRIEGPLALWVPSQHNELLVRV